MTNNDLLASEQSGLAVAVLNRPQALNCIEFADD